MKSACERCSTQLSSAAEDCPVCSVEGRRSGEPWLGRLLAGRYRVLRKLGQGASARVLLVRDVETGEDVAMKSMRTDRSEDPDAFDRFMREARVLNRVRHAHVVSVRDVGELEDGYVFLTMEYVSGETVAELLRHGPVDEGVAVDIAIQIADALVAIHEAGVVHRDLKPSNVLLYPGGGSRYDVKLVDFGIAALMHAVSITGSYQRLGTPGYMAPEYLRLGRESPRTDQYSLGVMLYEMLSLRMPYEAATHGRLLMKQTSEPPTPLRDRLPTVLPELEALVMRTLAPDPDARFADCVSFAAELRGWRSQLPGDANRGPIP